MAGVQPPLTVLGYDKDTEDGLLNEVRGKAQSNTRKIHDMQVQFEEARVRIDRLLAKKSRTRSDFDGSMYTSGSYRATSTTTNDDDVDAPAPVATSTTAVKIQMKPNTNKSFAPVTLTVNVNDEDDE